MENIHNINMFLFISYFSFGFLKDWLELCVYLDILYLTGQLENQDLSCWKQIVQHYQYYLISDYGKLYQLVSQSVHRMVICDIIGQQCRKYQNYCLWDKIRFYCV